MDVLATPWVNAWVAYLLEVQWAAATVKDHKVDTKVLDPTEYDEVFTTKGSKIVDMFSSKIIHARMKTAFIGTRLNIMTQALCSEESVLPKGLMVQKAYTEMHNGSKSVTDKVRNSTACPHILKKKIPVARVVAANLMPKLQMWPGIIDALDEAQGVQALRMTMAQRQEKLFEKLDLSNLESWPPELADSVHLLLAEYHDIFSLEPSEAVLIGLSMWSKSPMMPSLKNNSGRSLCPLWKKSVHTYKRC